MTTKRRPALALCAATLLSLMISGGAPAAAPGRRSGPPMPDRFAVGRYVPEIALPSADDGRLLSLASFRGRRTILHIFASW